MKNRQIYSKIRVRKNQRGAKSSGAQKLEARKLKVRNLKGCEFNELMEELSGEIVCEYNNQIRS